MKNLETILSEELRPVAAPPGLVDRLNTPAVEPRIAERRMYAWPLAISAAAAVLVVAAAWGLRARNEIRSADPAEMRAWVQSHAGLDVPFSPHTPVRLERARLVQGRAEISYRVEDFSVKLLVARGTAGQVSGQPVYDPGASSTTWALGGQIFSLECPSPKALQAACRLCHA